MSKFKITIHGAGDETDEFELEGESKLSVLEQILDEVVPIEIEVEEVEDE